MTLIRFTLLILLLTACNPLLPEQISPPELPDSYASSSSEEALKPPERWWEDFSDERLNGLQQQLFSGNLSLRQALFRLDQLDAAQRISGVGRLPSVSLKSSLGRSQNVSSSGEYRSTNNSLSLAASYEVDIWNKLKDTEQAAVLRSQAGEKDVEALLLSLSAQLTEQYFLATEQRAQLDLLNRRIDNSQELLSIISDRYKAGLSTAAEIYQARLNLATMKSQAPSYQLTLVQAENTIALLLGQLPRSISIENQQLPQLTSMVDLGLPADLMIQRPDISSAMLELQASDKDLAAALADRLPTIDLTATLGESATHLASGNYSGTFWSLALGLTQPLFDGGRLKATSDQKEAARQEQLAATEEVMLTAIEEIESALTAETKTGITANLLEERRQINQSNLELLRRNYLYGLTDSSDLLSSEINHLDILSHQLTTHRQQLSHRISLVRALGGRWMTNELSSQRQALNAEQE